MSEHKNKFIFLKPAFVPKIWGSQKLKQYFPEFLTNEKIGEAWLISSHPNGMSYVLNGKFKGISLKELYEKHPIFFGYPIEKQFPLLTKILDANDHLSVQMHPNDDYAQKHHKTLGKTECWYVLDCPPNQQVIYGHRAKTKAEWNEKIAKQDFVNLWNYLPIKKGDFVYVPDAKVHGLLANTIVFELQQSSDITYRLYDYNRQENGKLRTLHLDNVADIVVAPDKNTSEANGHDNFLVDNRFFKLIKIINQGTKNYHYPNVKWMQVSILEGFGTIDQVPIKKGDSFIITNGYHDFTLTGDLLMMLSYC